MKKAGWALALASTMMFTSAAWAMPQSNDPTIEVSGRDGASWASTAASEFTANLDYPRPFNGDYHAGLVKVGFHSDGTGHISDVSLLQSSNDSDLDLAAMRAVRRARALKSPPASVAAGRPVQAWIYFASNDRDERRMLDRVRRDLTATSQSAATDPLIVTTSAQ